MKKLILIFTGILTAGMLSTTNAQDKKLSFGVNIGYAMPGGDLSSSDVSKQPIVEYPSTDTTHISGYATGGFHFDIYGSYMFVPQVGVMLSYGGSMNGYDITKLNENYATAFSTGGGTGTVPGFTASGSYFIGQLLVGPYVKIPAGDKLRIEFKGLVGLMMANYPALSYSFSESFGGQTIAESATYTPKSSSGFSYNVGAGLEYMLNDMLGLHFNVAYGGGTASYPSYTISSSATVGTSSSSSTETHSTPTTMSVGLITVTVGASIDL